MRTLPFEKLPDGRIRCMFCGATYEQEYEKEAARHNCIKTRRKKTDKPWMKPEVAK